MAKRKKGRHGKGGRVTPKGTRPGSFGPSDPPQNPDTQLQLPAGPGSWEPFRSVDADPEPEPDFDLLGLIRGAMDAEHPLELLWTASVMMDTVDSRNDDPFSSSKHKGEPPAIHGLVEGFADVGQPEIDVLLSIFGELTTDELLARRISQLLANRRPQDPDWLPSLGDSEIQGVVELRQVLGDECNILVGLRVGELEQTAVVFVDHNAGSLVRDAFFLTEPIDSVRALMDASSDPVEADQVAWIDLDPADGRARIAESIAIGAMTVPRVETETWPQCRPLLEWAIGLMPEGGRGYERPDWPEKRRAKLTERFFGSEIGAAFDDADRRGLLESLLWFGVDYGAGDPMRWSGQSVGILLTDWMPRKVVADVVYLSQLPDLLRAFVRFCHAECEIPEVLTADTFDAIDHFEPDYLELIGSPRPQGPAALIARMLGSDAGDDDAFLESFGIDLDALQRRELEERSGGAAALAVLTTDPLPDEPFDWSEVASDTTDRVTEVLDLIDAFAEANFGMEFRTASRRLLCVIASRAPQVFRRRGAASSAAAALAWVVARDNDLLSSAPGSMPAQDLVAAFGRTGSVSQRAGTMLKNASLASPSEQFHCPPEMLLSSTRLHLIGERDSPSRVGLLGSDRSAIPARRAPDASQRRPRRSSGRSGTDTVHQMKVTLEGIRPPVWRRLLVASDATLAELHQILQMSFGWEDAHLHDFEVDGVRFAPEEGFVDFGFDMGIETADEGSVTLAEVLDEGARGLYNYDFGDGWCHRIVVEAVEPPEPGAQYPQCAAGRRSGPPEDVGGPWGYGEFLAALDDPEHEEHEHHAEWIGGGWDPDAFDRDRLTLGLLQLPRSPRRPR